jgi:hypothetical protein
LAKTGLGFYQTIPTWLIDGITIRDSAHCEARGGFLDEHPDQFWNNGLTFYGVRIIVQFCGCDNVSVLHSWISFSCRIQQRLELVDGGAELVCAAECADDFVTARPLTG